MCYIRCAMLFVLADGFFPLCFQTAGPHVEWCITGFNVPGCQHQTGKYNQYWSSLQLSLQISFHGRYSNR